MLSLVILSAVSLVERGAVAKRDIVSGKFGPEVSEVLRAVFALLKKEKTAVLLGKETCVGLFALQRGKAKKRDKEYFRFRPETGREELTTVVWHELFDGQKHGRSISYKSGEIFSECTYSNGTLHGKAVVYWASGNIKSECNYKRGKIHGVAARYWTTGGKSEVFQYNNGVRCGQYFSYHSDGRLRATHSYVDGKKHGKGILWDKLAEVSRKCKYDRGILVF